MNELSLRTQIKYKIRRDIQKKQYPVWDLQKNGTIKSDCRYSHKITIAKKITFRVSVMFIAEKCWYEQMIRLVMTLLLAVRMRSLTTTKNISNQLIAVSILLIIEGWCTNKIFHLYTFFSYIYRHFIAWIIKSDVFTTNCINRSNCNWIRFDSIKLNWYCESARLD